MLIDIDRQWFRQWVVVSLALSHNLTSAELLSIGPLETNFNAKHFFEVCS